MKGAIRLCLIILLAAGCSQGVNPVSFSDGIGHGASVDFSEYEIENIGSFISTLSAVIIDHVDINDQGTVVGSGADPQGEDYYSFIWTVDEGFQAIDNPATGKKFQAFTINDNGVIGGSLRGTSNEPHPAIRTPDGNYIELDVKAKYGAVRDINNSGVVTGDTDNSAFVWAESYKEIIYFDAKTANSINESGFIVGQDRDSFGYIRSPEGAFTALSSLRNSTLNDINNFNDAAGIQTDEKSGATAGFFRSAAGSIIDIGTFGDGTESWAAAINDYGQIAGYGDKNQGETIAPFIWTEETGIVELPVLSKDGFYALAINNSGTIAGSAINNDDNSHACIWTLPQGPHTPDEYVTAVLDLVDDLVTGGILGTKQAKPLITKLDSALKKLESNNIQGAVGSLNAAVNQVESMVYSGKLTEEQAAPLLEMLAGTISSLGG